MDTIKNEYLTANFFSNPHARQHAIVVPDLERPGSVANP